MSEGVPALPPAVLASGIDRLHLDATDEELLRGRGLLTIGDVVALGAASGTQPRPRRREGRAALSSALAAIDQLAAHVTADGVDWRAFWRARGVLVVPASARPSARPIDLLEGLPEIIRAALADDRRAGADPGRDWVVIDGRNGLLSQPMTLEELGSGVLDLTRERVRQIEAKAMLRVREAWRRGFRGVGYRIDPGFDPVLDRLRDEVANVHGLVPEDELFERLGIGMADRGRLHRLAAFLLELCGLEAHPAAGARRPAVWARAGDPQAADVVALADRVGRYLTDEVARPCSPTEIALGLNRGAARKASLAEVERALVLTPLVEPRDDGRWQGRFEHLAHRPDQAYRVIRAADGPVELAEVVRQINARSRGKPVAIRNLSNQLAGDDRFVPIGKSGAWGLADRDAHAAATIVDLMNEALRKAGRPQTAAEIAAWVAARRPVAETSISMYLTMRPEFVGLADRTWVLAEWPEARDPNLLAQKRAQRPRVLRNGLATRMRDVVVPFLQAAPGGERELGEVVAHVTRAMDTIPATVYAYLRKIPEVARIDEGSRRIVRLVAAEAGAGGAPAPALWPPSATPERVRALIAGGEKPDVEFKSTIRWNVDRAMDDPETITKMVTKTIAAFANTAGGTLLIGVEAKGGVCGIEADRDVLPRKGDTLIDAFSLYFTDVCTLQLGYASAATVATQYVELDEGTVCVVDVRTGEEPLYLKTKRTDKAGQKTEITEFYVRIGTTSQALPLEDLNGYIRRHWK